MKAQVSTISTTITHRFRRGKAGLALLLAIVAAGVGVLVALRGGVTAAPAAVIPASVGVPAALDQHERHVTANAGVPAALDQHERHLTPNAGVPAALDQHERHPKLGDR